MFMLLAFVFNSLLQIENIDFYVIGIYLSLLQNEHIDVYVVGICLQ